MSKHTHVFNGAAKMNEGHLPAAEQSTFHKGEQGKGANIGGKVTAMGGSSVPINNDPHASNLRKTWSQAERSGGRFSNF